MTNNRPSRILTFIGVLVCAAGLRAQSRELVPSELIVPKQFVAYYDTVHTVYLPKEFPASLYYTGQLGGPRFMAFDPTGRLCVTDNSAKHVVALQDLEGDGVADTAIVIADNDDAAHSIGFHNGELYAASSTQVLRYSNPNSAGIYQTRSVFIDSIPDKQKDPQITIHV